MKSPQILWLRRDLRLADQPALFAAAQAGPVIPVYILDDAAAGDRQMGGASRWWLHHSLRAMQAKLAKHNSRLILRRGNAADEICKLAAQTGAGSVHAIRHYEPWWRDLEKDLRGRLDLRLYDGNYLAPPGTLKTGGGTPFKIFTPFYKAFISRLEPADPLPQTMLEAPETWPESQMLDDWGLLPTAPDWAGGLARAWICGEDAAHARLADFAARVRDYDWRRNLPSVDGSSRLSPHLHFGEISPGQIWRAVDGQTGEGADSFRREVVWRDYAQNIIAQTPDYAQKNYRSAFDDLAWRDPLRDEQAAADLRAWQQGRTGYPIVDAGMRQLWHNGWMHNRVRMIAASFLVKHLLIHWRHGERWFWDTLVDADIASNGVNWQWVAGTGVDANMFVRIMAPLSQSEKFAAGPYIRQWVPELADLDEPYIHDPEGYGCRPDQYQRQIIGHKMARERALLAYRQLKAE